MKKFNKVISLLLALVLVIGAAATPAFAKTVHGNDGYAYVYTKDGTLSCAYWSTEGKGPVVIYSEIDNDGFDNRTWALNRVKDGKSSTMYYMDAEGNLWTDMPKYGGTLVAVDGSAEKDVALYGKITPPTIYERYQKTNRNYISLYRDGMGTPDTTSAGFTDVPDNAWYANAVNALANAGILNGYGNGKFGPLDTMTWQHVYYIMFTLLGINGEYLPTTMDDSQTPSYDTKARIVDLVLYIQHHDDLSQPVNRAEAVALITMLYSVSAMNIDLMPKYSTEYSIHFGPAAVRADEAVANGAKRWTVDDIPDGQKAVALLKDFSYYSGIGGDLLGYAYTIGIVRGVDSKGTLNAAGSLTRAEFCQMLYNAGILGCVYPYVCVVSMPGVYFEDYMMGHYVDGTPVEGYKGTNMPAFNSGAAGY